MNLKEPDDTDFVKLNLMRQTTLGAFLIFEKELAEYAARAGRGIVSLDECFEIGAKLKMGPDMVISLDLILLQIYLPLLPSCAPQTDLHKTTSTTGMHQCHLAVQLQSPHS